MSTRAIKMLLSASAVLAFSLSCRAEGGKVETMPVVNAHVGNDDSIAKTFVYDAPSGYIIDSYKVIEVRRGGDTNYSVHASPDSRSISVSYTLRSHRIRGPFKVVLDTKTAALALDLQVTLTEAKQATGPPQDDNQSPSLNVLRVYSPYLVAGLLAFLIVFWILRRPLRRIVGRAFVRVGEYLGNPPD